jgi:hypothetical protein
VEAIEELLSSWTCLGPLCVLLFLAFLVAAIILIVRFATASGRVATKTCPFCGEEIRESAIKCKHCGEFLDDDEHRGR